jgi:hypothetical protein
MNERIRELADEAGLRFTQLMSNPMVPIVDGRETDLEKFAELLIRECAQVCRDQPNIYALKADRDNCAIAIEQHFGVTE